MSTYSNINLTEAMLDDAFSAGYADAIEKIAKRNGWNNKGKGKTKRVINNPDGKSLPTKSPKTNQKPRPSKYPKADATVGLADEFSKLRDGVARLAARKRQIRNSAAAGIAGLGALAGGKKLFDSYKARNSFAGKYGLPLGMAAGALSGAAIINGSSEKTASLEDAFMAGYHDALEKSAGVVDNAFESLGRLGKPSLKDKIVERTANTVFPWLGATATVPSFSAAGSTIASKAGVNSLYGLAAGALAGNIVGGVAGGHVADKYIANRYIAKGKHRAALAAAGLGGTGLAIAALSNKSKDN